MGISWDNFYVDPKRVYFKENETRTDGHPEGVRRYHRLWGFILRILRISTKEVINGHVYYLNRSSLIDWMNQQNLLKEYRDCSLLNECLQYVLASQERVNEGKKEKTKEHESTDAPPPFTLSEEWRKDLFHKFKSTTAALNEEHGWDRLSVSELQDSCAFVVGNPEKLQQFKDKGKTLILKLSSKNDGGYEVKEKEGYRQIRWYFDDPQGITSMDDADENPIVYKPAIDAYETIFAMAKNEGFVNVQLQAGCRREWIDQLPSPTREQWITNMQFLFLKVVGESALIENSCIKEVLYVEPLQE